MSNEYKDAEDSFLRMIENLATDLAEYSLKPNANPRYIARQESLIKVMNRYFNSTYDKNFELRDENLFLENYNKEKENEIEKLTGLCLLHGINDITLLMRKTLPEIIADVKQAYAGGWRKTPIAFLTLQLEHI